MRGLTESTSVPCIANHLRWRSFMIFVYETFPACAIGSRLMPKLRKVFELILHTVKVFHLEQFAMYSICTTPEGVYPCVKF